MELRINFSHILTIYFTVTVPALASTAPPTAEMRATAEKSIKTCEQIYANVKNLSSRFDQVKKPSMIAPEKQKNAYYNLAITRKVFEIRLAEFSTFTNDKIKIRNAPTVRKLQEEIAAYSSNCTRFAAGLERFVEWATTGNGYEVSFQDWVNEVRRDNSKASSALPKALQ